MLTVISVGHISCGRLCPAEARLDWKRFRHTNSMPKRTQVLLSSKCSLPLTLVWSQGSSHEDENLPLGLSFSVAIFVVGTTLRYNSYGLAQELHGSKAQLSLPKFNLIANFKLDFGFLGDATHILPSKPC